MRRNHGDRLDWRFGGLLTLSGALTAAVILAASMSTRSGASAVHPPHSKIVFTRAYPYRYGVYSIRPDGSHQHRIRSDKSAVDAFAHSLALSPDGRKVAVGSIKFSADIFVMNADGSHTHPLTRTNRADEGVPAWSPSGQRIAFHSRRQGSEGHLFVMNADGTHRRRIPRTLRDNQPAFAPSGNRIAFATHCGQGACAAIYTARLDGTNKRRITPKAAENTDPDFSPSGKRIAFASNRNGTVEIYTMRTDGTHPRQLTHNSSSDAVSPSYSPSGRRIVFASGQDLFTISTDGSHLRQLTHNDELFQSPAAGNPDWGVSPIPR